MGPRSIAVLLCICVSVAWIITSLPAYGGGDILVGPEVQVSSANAQTRHDEVLLAADPSDARYLIACSILMLTSNQTQTIVYTSLDGGLHWQPTLNSSRGLYTGDPACAYGLNGRAYFATLGSRKDADGHLHGLTAVYRSIDEGRTWPSSVALPSVDREYLTVDTVSKRYRGRVYLNATEGASAIDSSHDALLDFVNAIGIMRSTDHGKSFYPPVQLMDTNRQYVLGMGNGAVLSDGTFAAVFGDLKDEKTGWDLVPGKATARLKIVTSHDGGEEFSSGTVIDDWQYCNIESSSDIPMLAVDESHGPFRDRLYAAWPDMRSGRCQIMLSSSSDKGKTWTKAIAVNDDYANSGGNGPDDFMPLVAVNSNGVVGLAWYDRRDSPDNTSYYVRFAASFDGGETFAPSVRVSSVPSELQHDGKLMLDADASSESGRMISNLSLGGFSFTGGHTAGIAADARGVFHPLWVDNRTGTHQVWTAAVAVAGKSVINGTSDLAPLEDVSQKLSMDMAHAQYDFASQTGSVDVSFLNDSSKPIRGPIKARVLVVNSSMGVVRILNADNGLPGPGAVWDFPLRAQSNALMAGSRTPPKRLLFEISHLRKLRPGSPSGSESTFVRLEMKMLAPKAKKG